MVFTEPSLRGLSCKKKGKTKLCKKDRALRFAVGFENERGGERREGEGKGRLASKQEVVLDTALRELARAQTDPRGEPSLAIRRTGWPALGRLLLSRIGVVQSNGGRPPPFSRLLVPERLFFLFFPRHCFPGIREGTGGSCVWLAVCFGSCSERGREEERTMTTRTTMTLAFNRRCYSW